ncbi:MAG: hypothetical protein RLZZ584_2547, partial [Pseudomonadota bacterium]
MNRNYRLVWNALSASHVPAPETARGRGKGSTRSAGSALRLGALGVYAAGLTLSGQAWALDPGALPTGGKVVSGNTALNQAGNQLTVNQASNRTTINWSTYNIGSQASVVYVQPGADAVALNRIVGNDPSQIYGKLQANGQVFLVNPNGVLFGKGAEVNVHGLLASTLDISDADFAAGRLKFAGRGGLVRNEGSLSADQGGYIAMLGGQVDNSGTISARLGSVQLAAGTAATLDFNGDGLLSLALDAGAARALVDNSGVITADGGQVRLSARAADDLVRAVVNNRGRVEARGLVQRNGVIELAGDIVDNSGALLANGADGGSITLSGNGILQGGVIQADGASGQGGTVRLQASHTLLQTVQGEVHADGATAGGSVVAAGEHLVYLSGSLSADGATGGSVVASGANLNLAGAQVSADGITHGGTILLGGDAHGGHAGMAGLANAGNTHVGKGSVLSASGSDGRIVVWSDGDTSYGGDARTGPHGFIEISAKAELRFGGTADPGTGGTLLLDPFDLVIGQGSATSFTDLANVDSTTGEGHGSGGVYDLGNGNVVVATPDDNFAGNANTPPDLYTGAVYTYRVSDGALLSSLYGTTFGDAVGSGGVTVLTNGNFVVASPQWHEPLTGFQVGAVTWRSGLAIANSAVSTANSLVGTTDGDRVGSLGVTALSNGNYVVASPDWLFQTGAATWGNGTTGTIGEVSVANSLVGTTPGDAVSAGGIVALTGNGNYVVVSPNWQSYAGAATWGNGNIGGGVSGEVTAANSLVGENPFDSIGVGGVTALTNGHYVVNSYYWNFGSGAVTWADGNNGGTVGLVTANHSLLGDVNGVDFIGSGGVTALSDGNYVVASPSWTHNTVDTFVVEAGAVTWRSGTGADVDSQVSAANSLIGTADRDQVGYNGVVALDRGRYVVVSSQWNDSVLNTAGTYDVVTPTVGAVTVVDPSIDNGVGIVNGAGIVSRANSLTGVTEGDQVGSAGVTALANDGVLNGKFVVSSPNWSLSGTPGSAEGAVTWVDANAGTSGVVSSTNSLYGENALDQVGIGGVTALRNGNYVVSSYLWTNTFAADGGVEAGAATWRPGALIDGADVGTAVSIANSLYGTASYDHVSSGTLDGQRIVELNNNNYVVVSPEWGGNLGAVTWRDGTGFVGEEVGAPNSLIGTTFGDQIGSRSVIALSNGDYVVASPYWSDPLDVNRAGAGAVWVSAGAPGGITPADVANMTPGASTVILQADNNITVNAVVSVGRALQLDAGNNIILNAALESTAATPDALVLHATGNFINNAGPSALSTPNSNWQVWTSDPAGDVRGGLAYDFKQYNAFFNISTPAQGGNGVFYTVAPQLDATLTATGAVSKRYDGTTAISAAGAANLTLAAASGAIDGDSITLTGDLAYAGKNAATAVNVVASNIVVRATDGATGVPVYGYDLVDPSATAVAAGVGTIDKALLTVATTVTASKVYDGSNAAQFSSTFSGVVAGESLALSQTGTYNSKNVADATTITVSNSFNPVGVGANYAFDVGQDVQTFAGSIVAKSINVSGLTGVSRTYDGTLNATVNVAAAQIAKNGTTALDGRVVGAEDVTINAAGTVTGHFADKNVGTNKSVIIDTGLALSGVDAANYVIGASPVAGAAITARAVTVGGITAADKTYDATRTATLNTAGAAASFIAGDNVLVTVTGQFADKNAGAGKTVALSSSYSGTDVGNYVITDQASTTASI